MTIRNPKMAGTSLWDCVPQSGKCPIGCSQCFFNRPGAFYTEVPSIPTPGEVGDGIVRMNAGNDSNIDRKLVIQTAKQYKHFFFNTSIPRFDFPGPVVLTANPKEEGAALPPGSEIPRNLMFIRLRVSGTNLRHVSAAATRWTSRQVPVVLTFMSYYDRIPQVDPQVGLTAAECYEWKIRHINSYHCPTPAFMRLVMGRFASNRLVSMCGSIESPYCRNCRNCETHYWQTKKRMGGE